MLRGWEKKKFSASFCRLRNKTQGDQTASPKTLRAGIASEYPEIPTPTSTQRSLLHQGALEKPLVLMFMFYFTFLNPSHSTTLAGAVVHTGRDIQPASDRCWGRSIQTGQRAAIFPRCVPCSSQASVSRRCILNVQRPGTDLSIPCCNALRFRLSEQWAKKEIISLCQRRRGKPRSLKNKKKKQTRLSLLVSLQ